MPATPLFRHAKDVFIEDNVYYLGDPDDPASPLYTGKMPTPDATGLVASGGGVEITCGVHIGDVHVTVEVWPDSPPVVLDAWDDAAETSATWAGGHIEVIGGSTDDVPGFPVELPSGAGTYRVRAYVRGRDAGEDRGQDDPPEEHVVQIWPAPAAPETLLKATDQVGSMARQHRSS
jgi:hypothetical protein